MIKMVESILSPQEAFNPEDTLRYAAGKLNVNIFDITGIRWLHRSIDARKRPIKINARFDVFIGEKAQPPKVNFAFNDVSQAPEVHIVGAGPAGYFAALELIQLGLRPVVFDRGKDVSSRKRDIALLSKNQGLNPDSNYAFGEGGAGTFSDGKLYTRVKRKEEIRKILELFYYHGAQENILFESHPHIGSDVLPRVIQRIRETIETAGGKVLFNSKLTDLVIENGKIDKVIINENESFDVSCLILATGHSASDIYELLEKKGIALEPKGFAMGVRIEHPQELINRIQYHGKNYDPWLPAASYSLTRQVDDRGVYSFCMCPGGIIVPATTDEKRTVVNGMSNSQRNSPFANSGMVVELQLDDFLGFGRGGAFSGLDFQAHLEQLAFNNGGRGQVAPAQRTVDFVNGKLSPNLPRCSYSPGVVSSPLHAWLPEPIGKRLRKALVGYGKQIPGFLTNEALLVGVESRTSSPVRIPRDRENMHHIQIQNLYPCGEGAGYAGGIVSSAIDGMLAARAVSVVCKCKK